MTRRVRCTRCRESAWREIGTATYGATVYLLAECLGCGAEVAVKVNRG